MVVINSAFPSRVVLLNQIFKLAGPSQLTGQANSSTGQAK